MSRCQFLFVLLVALLASMIAPQKLAAQYRAVRPAGAYVRSGNVAGGSVRYVYRPQTTSYASSGAHVAYRPVYSSTGKLVRNSRSRPSIGTAKSTRTTRTNPEAYRLGDGDTLGIIVDGVLGTFEDAPVHMPKSKDSDMEPGIGFPVVVRNGSVALPSIDPVPVTGLTVSQAQKKISNSYLRERILKHDNRVMVTMLRKRRVRVTVVHDDVAAAPRFQNSQQYASLYQTPRKKISTVTLPADRAHLLDALSAAVADLDSEEVVRIVERHRRSLQEGQVVTVKSAPRQSFYTGGLIPAGEFPLPRDRQLNAMQAMAMAGGSFASHRGGAYVGPSNLLITRQNGQTVRVDFERLRANPNAVMVRPGDTLMLQYKPREVIGNTAVQAIGSGAIRLRP